MTNNYKLIVYKKSFCKFKLVSNDVVRRFPAQENDEFATITASSDSGIVGFRTTAASQEFLRRLVGACYFLDSSRKCLRRPGEFKGESVPSYIFMGGECVLEGLITEHEKYILDCNKYRLMSSRYDLEYPRLSSLSEFLECDGREIKPDLYKKLFEACKFFGLKLSAGEYGWGAYDITASDMEGVLCFISDLAAPCGNLTMVVSSEELPVD